MAKHGRQPSTRTIIRLRAQATLATRPDKTVRSLISLTAGWRARAAVLLGADATAWARQLLAASGRQVLLRADDVPLEVVEQIGRTVVAVVGEKRATWRRWNLHAKASRQLMGWRFASTADREAVLVLVVDAAQAASLQLTPPELAFSPLTFKRADGSSVFRPRHSTLYSSTGLLDAEDHLLDLSRTTSGPTMPLATIERHAWRRPARDPRRGVPGRHHHSGAHRRPYRPGGGQGAAGG